MRPRLAVRVAMATILPIDGNNIPPIDRETRRQRTKVESLRKRYYRVALKAKSSNDGIQKFKAFDCKMRKLAAKLAKIVNGVLLKVGDVEAQQDIVTKLMDFDLLKKSIPPYILCAKEAKVQAKIIENIRTSINVVSHVKTKDHRVVKHVMLSMACLDMVGMCQQWLRFLGFITAMCLM